jgi:hypothetical protein
MYECQLIFKWCSWPILIVIHDLNSRICDRCGAHHCFAVPCSCLTHRPSFATGEEWSKSDWRSTSCMGKSIFPSCSWSNMIIIHVLNSQICDCCNAHHCFAVPCSYLTHRLSFATGEEWSQSDWRSNTCMGKSISQLQLVYNDYILCSESQICGGCNAHHCFAVPCSSLTHRPSFATGEEWSQSDWRSNTCMGKSIFPVGNGL